MIRSELCSKVEIHFQKKAPKVEKVLKGSLDSIPLPSPSVKTQIMGVKICFRCKGKTLLGIVNKLENKKFVDITQQCFALLPKVNFPEKKIEFSLRVKVMGSSS